MAATPLLDSRPWRLWVVPHTHWDREWYLPARGLPDPPRAGGRRGDRDSVSAITSSSTRSRSASRPTPRLLRRSQDYRFDFVEGAPGVELDPPFEVDGDLFFSALKAAEDGDGAILRVFNAGDADAELPLAADAERCRLDEGALANGAPIRPGEVAGFRLRGPL
jgi:hypothetical protein